jgi:endonuclease III
MSRDNAVVGSTPAVTARSPEAIQSILTILEAAYGSPRHGNPANLLDDLIYLKLSQQTNAVKFVPVFESLRRRGWEWVMAAPEDELAGALRYLGLHRQRAAQLQAMLRRIQHDTGRLDLEHLRTVPWTEAAAYLTSLPGVGIKTACCAVMYTLGAPVLPVDTHVGRVAARLGLIPESAEYKGSGVHRALEMHIPPEARAGFHMNAVAHGRRICTTSRPKCRECVLLQHCAYGARYLERQGA